MLVIFLFSYFPLLHHKILCGQPLVWLEIGFVSLGRLKWGTPGPSAQGQGRVNSIVLLLFSLQGIWCATYFHNLDFESEKKENDFGNKKKQKKNEDKLSTIGWDSEKLVLLDKAVN